MVFVISIDSKAFMPTSNPKARILLRQKRIWRQNNNQIYLKKQFWKEKIVWGDGYFACSIGQVSKETIEKYIQNQG